MEVRSIPAGRVVSTMHKGAYGEVGKAYKAGFDFMTKKGLAPIGPTRELYLNDPNETPESELLTEIQVPVQG